MAADVSSLVRTMNGGGGGGGDTNDSASSSSAAGKSTAPMTLDLLDSMELDLDLQVPCGWEKRLDLKSGNIYLERCSSSQSKQQNIQKSVDLNFPTESKLRSTTLNRFDDPSLELKLVSLSSSSNYQSVCTLDKVKSALERAKKETTVRNKRSMSSISSSIRSSSSSSIKLDSDVDQEEKLTIPVAVAVAASFAAGCPNCLMYVLISKSNPRCPRCTCYVPLPVAAKKPRIDLNISI
ncbi:hypothetical protein OROHE_019490 [Orobanche hederae]